LHGVGVHEPRGNAAPYWEALVAVSIEGLETAYSVESS